MNKADFVNRWDSDVFPNKEIGTQIFIDLKKNLKTSPHPFSSWRSVPNQKLKTISINENGFRSKSLKNLKFKNNAILLGGSVAWGFGATSNENIPSYLIEKILYEKYGLEYNVINLAEQMFTSFEELKVFMSTADELDPKLVISLSGCNDVNAAYSNKYKSNDLYKISNSFFAWGVKLGIIHEKNFLKKIIKILIRSHKNSDELDEDFLVIKKPGQKQIAIKLFENKLSWINNYCSLKKIPIVHVLQPDLIFKSNKSKFEAGYIDSINPEKLRFIRQAFKELESNFFLNKTKSENELYLNFLNIFDNFEKTIYVDKAHTSDEGYKIIAEKICLEIDKNIKF